MGYVYFEADNIALFIEWLQKRPDGKYSILIGRNKVLTKVAGVLNFVEQKHPELAEWLKQKRVNNEIVLAMSTKMTVTQG